MICAFNDLTQHPNKMQHVLCDMGVDAVTAPVVAPLLIGAPLNIVRIRLDLQSYCLKQLFPQPQVTKNWLQTAEKIAPNAGPYPIGVESLRNRDAWQTGIRAPA